MSLLWRNSIMMQLKTIQKRPSPKHNNYIQSLAQSLLSFQDKNTPNLFKFSAFIKGISFFISEAELTQASMSVEAAIVLPLFLFFFLNLMSSIEMLRLHGNLELALWETCTRMSVYGSVLSDTAQEEGMGKRQNSDKEEKSLHNTAEGESWWKELAGVAWSYMYVKSEIIEYLGQDYLEQSPLAFGTDSLQFLESNVFENSDCFEVVVTYSVAPLCSISGFRPFRMANRYYGHLWNGYELPEAGETFVFVAENGEVYHADRNCSHLKLSIRLVTRQQAYTQRNEKGKKYTACEKCSAAGMTDAVYITDAGACYHCNRDCPGLKRTVACIPFSQIENLRPCLRCAQSR